MATAYPGALDTSGSQLRTDISSTDDLDATGKQHDVMHVNVHGATIALETKLGLTDSNASSGAILVGSGTSTTSWTTSPTVTGTLTAGVAVGQAVDLDRKTADYTLVLADAGKVIEINSGSAENVTIPPNSSVAFPLGTQVVVVRLGAGDVTIVEGSGVTTRSDGDKAKIKTQYSSCVLIKHETNEWYILGNLA
tara:strand:+ start:686 stop:1267 length:582 start_codon:yes stop_codon:yes gene_type:complete